MSREKERDREKQRDRETRERQRDRETVEEKAGTREWTGHHFTQYLHSTAKQKPAILFRKKDIEKTHWTILLSFPTTK